MMNSETKALLLEQTALLREILNELRKHTTNLEKRGAAPVDPESYTWSNRRP